MCWSQANSGCCNCFWRSAKIYKFYATLKLLLTHNHMGLEIQNDTPCAVFIQFGPNFMINTAVIGEYKIMDILALCQKLKILWHFENLT